MNPIMKFLKDGALTLLALSLCTSVCHSDETRHPKMNGKLIVDTLPPEDVCYTGKPYNKELGAYVFNARNYDATISRWTTPDPSGFPDGANNSVYVKNRSTCSTDAIGLFYSGGFYMSVFGGSIADRSAWSVGYATKAGPMTQDSMDHADGDNGGNWTLADWEIALVKGCTEYSTFYSDTVNALTLAFGGAPQGSSGWSTAASHYKFISNSDVKNAIEGCDLSTRGTVTTGSSGIPVYHATVTLDDYYTFDPYANETGLTNPLRIGYALESHDWIYPFETTGTWDDTFE